VLVVDHGHEAVAGSVLGDEVSVFPRLVGLAVVDGEARECGLGLRGAWERADAHAKVPL
jgi:hypothetical protein